MGTHKWQIYKNNKLLYYYQFKDSLSKKIKEWKVDISQINIVVEFAIFLSDYYSKLVFSKDKKEYSWALN